MKKHDLKIKLLFALAILIVIILIAAVLNKWDRNLPIILDASIVKDSLRFEVLKFLLQLLCIVIVGGLLFKVAEWSRESYRLMMDVRIDFIRRLGGIYREVKKIRRRLRAGGLTTKYKSLPENIAGVQRQLYLNEMEKLNGCQLDLEGLLIEAKNLPEFVNLSAVSKKLTTMEEYMATIIDEYEEHGTLLQDDKRPIAFAELKNILTFTEKNYPRSPFELGFSIPYEEAIIMLK